MLLWFKYISITTCTTSQLFGPIGSATWISKCLTYSILSKLNIAWNTFFFGSQNPKDVWDIVWIPHRNWFRKLSRARLARNHVCVTISLIWRRNSYVPFRIARTKWHNIRKAKIPYSHRESADTIGNNQVRSDQARLS